MAENVLPLFAGAGKFYVYVYLDVRPKKAGTPIYVGKGTASNGRADVHWTKPCKNPLLSRILQKIRQAELAPEIKIVGWFDDEDEAFGLERSLIARFGRLTDSSGTLCNLTAGGEGLTGHTFSAEHRKKLSDAAFARVTPPVSQETREKLSAIRKGKKRPASAVVAMHDARRGVPLSDEAKRKLREAALSRPPRYPTQEEIEKRKATLAKPEVKAKLSAIAKANWAKRKAQRKENSNDIYDHHNS